MTVTVPVELRVKFTIVGLPLPPKVMAAFVRITFPPPVAAYVPAVKVYVAPLTVRFKALRSIPPRVCVNAVVTVTLEVVRVAMFPAAAALISRFGMLNAVEEVKAAFAP